MKNIITTKMKQIVQLILINKSLTLKDISEQLDISIRVVYYNISKINQILNKDSIIPVIETNNKGHIIINDITTLKNINYDPEEFKCSKEQRVNILLIIIGFDIESLNLNKLSKQLDVTRSTIKNDLNSVKNILMIFHLNLSYQAAFELIGSDDDIIRFRIEILSIVEYTLYKEEFEKTEYIMQDYFYKTFPKIKLRNIIPIITTFMKKNRLVAKDTEIYLLAKISLLILWYQKNNLIVTNNNYLSIDIYDLNYEDLLIPLESFSSISLSDRGCAQMKSLITTICTKECKEEPYFNCQIIVYLFNLISLLEKNNYIYFSEDKTLLEGLYYHLSKQCKIYDSHINAVIKESYQLHMNKDLESLVEDFCDLNKGIIDISTNQSKDLMKLHFANSIYRNLSKQKKQALLISGASHTFKNNLRNTLENLFHISITKIISKYDIPFYDTWENLDILLFTEDIPEFFNKDIPFMKINIIPDDTDFLKLSNLGVLPANTTIDLQDIYSRLQFLQKNDQLSVIETINNYLQEKEFSNIKGIWREDNIVLVKEGIDFQQAVLIIEGFLNIYYEYGQNNIIEIMPNRKEHHISIKIINNNPVHNLIYLMLKCFNQLNDQGILALSNQQIMENIKTNNPTS